MGLRQTLHGVSQWVVVSAHWFGLVWFGGKWDQGSLSLTERRQSEGRSGPASKRMYCTYVIVQKTSSPVSWDSLQGIFSRSMDVYVLKRENTQFFSIFSFF